MLNRFILLSERRKSNKQYCYDKTKHKQLQTTTNVYKIILESRNKINSDLYLCIFYVWFIPTVPIAVLRLPFTGYLSGRH